jgi:hypothetical protein
MGPVDFNRYKQTVPPDHVNGILKCNKLLLVGQEEGFSFLNEKPVIGFEPF